MSIDVRILVFNKKHDDVMAVVTKHNLGSHGPHTEFTCAGFWFRSYGGYDPSEISEAKEEGYFKPWMEREFVRYNCCTNMGWSSYGDTRKMQFPIAHMLAQYLAMYLNVEVMVDDPQSGEETWYRRTDNPEVHKILDGSADGFSMHCPNFCEQRDGPEQLMKTNEWKAAGCSRDRSRKTILGME